MVDGLATLDVLESESLGEWALSLGPYLLERLQKDLAGYEMVKEVRGLGLFCGIEFQAPRSLALRACTRLARLHLATRPH